MKKVQMFSGSFIYSSVIVYIVLSFFSCSQSDSSGVISWAPMDTLRSSVIIKSEALIDPLCLVVSDSVIVVGNYKGEPLLEFYSLDGAELIKIGVHGKGPNEIQIVSLLDFNKDKTSLLVNDLYSCKVLKYNIDTVLVKGDVSELETSFLNSDILDSSPTLIAYWKENHYIMTGSFVDGRIASVNKIDNNVHYYLKVTEEIVEGANPYTNNALFNSGISMSPNKQHLGSVVYQADMIDLFDASKDTLSLAWSHAGSLPNDITTISSGTFTQAVFTSESLSWYLGNCASNSFFYMIYVEKSQNELRKTGFVGNTIRRVSWDGLITEEFPIDRPVSKIYVDDSDTYIYAISQNEDGAPEIIKIVL